MRCPRSIPKLVCLLSLPIALGATACGSAASGPEARFVDRTDGLLTEMPWPSDAYRIDGRVKLAPLPLSGGDGVMAMQAAIETMDGFGTTTSAFFPVSEPVAVASQTSAGLIDLEKQTLIAKWPLYFREGAMQLVALAPGGTALQPGHEYAIIVFGGVEGASGPLRPSAAMQEALAARGRFASLSSYQKLHTYLQNNGLQPQAATAYTTHTRLDWYNEVAGALASTAHAAVVDHVYPESELDFLCGSEFANIKPGMQPGGGVRHEAMAYVIRGRMTGPRFLAKPNDPTAAIAAIDGTFEQTGTLEIPWILVLPKRSGGYAGTRVVHFQHGLGSNRSNVLAVANEHAKRGFATFGIDTLFHGDRVEGAVDNRVNSTRADGPDGFADLSGESAVINFFAVNGDTGNNLPTADPRLMRDHFRQATADLMHAIRFVKSGDLSPIRAADPAFADLSLDASKLVYTGESFGALLGACVLALDPELSAAVLDVGGGGVVLELVANSPSFAPLFGPLAKLFLDTTVDLDVATPPAKSQLSLNLAAMVLEPGDGLALSAIADPTKAALLLEAKDDEVVPNTSSEALAAAWGMKQVKGLNDDPVTAVPLVQAVSPYVAPDGMPFRVLVQIKGSTHTQYSLQEDSSRYVPPWPPFTMREQPLHVVHPIDRVRGLANNFIDGVVAGTPIVNEPL